MPKNYLFILFIALFFSSNLHSKVIYTDPVPNSKFVKTESSVIIGFDKTISKSLLNKSFDKLLLLSGSKSGIHTGNITIADGDKKIIFKPDISFQYDEIVTVTVLSGVKYSDGSGSDRKSFSFSTESAGTRNFSRNFIPEFYSYKLFNNSFSSSGKGEFPELTVTVNDNPSTGKIFLSNFPFTNIDYTPYLLIAENNGDIYSSAQLYTSALDFKKQPNGNLTFFSSKNFKYYELDTNYNLIDSFYCGNGYLTDGHELRMLDNSHALMMIYDSVSIDMSQIVAGGNPNALVIGLVIQEIDENKQVVFQWRSWDYIPITDAQHQDLTGSYIDYIHGNAIEQDSDGNILISSRHLDEITKIDRQSGDIIWRLGGGHNQFTFVNDPDGFNYQHGIRRLANGNIILFDNGNFHTPPHSRAVEYSLDEVNMTATLVWQYRHTPDIFGFAMGFAQRLDNGNTFISWGAASPTIVEVTPNGKVALEMSLPAGVYTYRAFKFNWNGNPSNINLTLGLIPTAFGLRQNFPNPFNPATKISYDIPENTFVNISVYDILGRLVKTLVNEQKRLGTYTISLSASDYPSGVYFYRLTTAKFTETKKMVVVK